MKYSIRYKEHSYIYNGEDTAAAIEKFKNRKVFGEFLVFGVRLLQYDAATRGQEWAQYIDNMDNEILVSKIN